jgi:hypothetical protein
MSGFMERVAPVVNETIRALAKTKFINDPIAGESYSRAKSIVSSAYKRHGKILETALRESLRESNITFGRTTSFTFRAQPMRLSAHRVRKPAGKAPFRMATPFAPFRST